ncbi:ACT domain-containing protein [Wukongibacter baidiensis]|uniref:ACT domain-containing protein n=1 Tax=Wukongibacter baidiensis TaxID=1723361 RepID=UPI003D7F9A87
MKNKYLVIDKKILPDVFEKVLKAKELIRSGKVKGITEAVKNVGISRSTFYKYKDYVFALSEGNLGKKVTISLLLEHETGILSDLLNLIADKKGNILTINQNIPINKIANVSITFDISSLEIDFDELMDEVKNAPGVIMTNLVAMG